MHSVDDYAIQWAICERGDIPTLSERLLKAMTSLIQIRIKINLMGQ